MESGVELRGPSRFVISAHTPQQFDGGLEVFLSRVVYLLE